MSGLTQPPIRIKKWAFLNALYIFPFGLLGLLIWIVSLGDGSTFSVIAVLAVADLFAWLGFAFYLYIGRHARLEVQVDEIRIRNLKDWIEIPFDDIQTFHMGRGSRLFSYSGRCLELVPKSGVAVRILAIPETFAHGTQDISSWVDYLNRRIAGEIGSAEIVDPVRQSIEAKQSHKFTIQRLGIFLAAALLLVVVFYKFNNALILVIPIILGTRYFISRVGKNK